VARSGDGQVARACAARKELERPALLEGWCLARAYISWCLFRPCIREHAELHRLDFCVSQCLRQPDAAMSERARSWPIQSELDLADQVDQPGG
jgi:hypothetical protein